MNNFIFLILLKSFYYKINKNVFFLAFFLTATFLYSQNPGGVKDYGVWLHNTKNDFKNNGLLNYHQSLNPLKLNTYQNLINNKYSFFVVFSSDENNEVKLIKIKNGKNQVSFTNRKINSNKETPFKKQTSTGIFVSYLTQYHKEFSSKNYLKIYEKGLNKKQGKNNIYEILYYPKYLNSLDLTKIQTYFSIKYGISLPKDSFYINSKNDTIWNPNKNKGFNHRITGISFDEKINLKQEKSHNSLFKNLVVEFSKKNSKFKKDEVFYMLFGDNNKKPFFIATKDNTLKIFNRIWKTNIRTNNSNFLSKVNFNFSLNTNSFLADDEDLWMLVGTGSETVLDIKKATFIKGELKDSTYYFNNVSFTKNSTYFSFAKLKKLTAEINVMQPSCMDDQSGNIDLKIEGGVLPYTIKITSETLHTSKIILNHNFSISKLKEGTYNVLVKDKSGQSYEETISIENILNSDTDITKRLFLENVDQGLEITPVDMFKFKDTFSYNWYLNGKKISKNKSLKVFECGVYKLNVKSKQGCERNIIFIVERKESLLNENVVIYPNPVDVNKEFQIVFNYKKERNVIISIYSLGGKLLFNDILNIKNGIKYYNINSIGKYLVVIKSDKKYITKKIIIK